MDPNRMTLRGLSCRPRLWTRMCATRALTEPQVKKKAANTSYFSLPKVSSALGRGRVFIDQPHTKSDQGEICLPNNTILDGTSN